MTTDITSLLAAVQRATETGTVDNEDPREAARLKAKDTLVQAIEDVCSFAWTMNKEILPPPEIVHCLAVVLGLLVAKNANGRLGAALAIFQINDTLMQIIDIVQKETKS